MLEDCGQYDMLVSTTYANGDRHMRADLSTALLKTTISTIKYLDKNDTSRDFSTLPQAEESQATVCIPQGTYLGQFVQEKFPGIQFIYCEQSSECIQLLKAEDCVLYADDEHSLHYRGSDDASLEVTGESLGTQYVVWPMKEDLPGPVSRLMNKWIYNAIENGTLDELLSFTSKT